MKTIIDLFFNKFTLMLFLTALFFVNLKAFIYDMIISYCLTKYTYNYLFNNIISPKLDKIKTLLDVGVGTGVPLKSIHKKLTGVQILGIDIDKNYIEKAQEIFQKEQNVEILEFDFYKMADSTKRFDLILFGGSFMLMPDREEALRIAKSLLNEGGSIVFLMTLYEDGTKLELLEKIKPTLKHFTTIDFGRLVYRREFLELLKTNGFDVIRAERITQDYSLVLKIVQFYCVEAIVKE